MASTGVPPRWLVRAQQTAGVVLCVGLAVVALPTGSDSVDNDTRRYVQVEAYYPRSDGMAISLRKVAGDSRDLNVDGGVTVKHGKDYRGTPGYADTLQVYTLAGSAGTILGNNNYVGAGQVPYQPPREAVQSNGFLRFELGPVWPTSEKMRLNNTGDLILGWEPPSLRGRWSQDGRMVTGERFTADLVGSYVTWLGSTGVADRVEAVIDERHLVVETPRTMQRQRAFIAAPRMLLDPVDSSVTIDGARLFVRDGALMFEGAAGTVTEIAPR